MANLLSMTTFDYDQVRLVPGKCVVQSRAEVDTSTMLNLRRFELPVVPANMSTIIDEELAVWLAQRDYFYVMHRFDVDPVKFTQRMHERGLISSISLGVKEQDYLDVRFMAQLEAPDFITIDIAHGDADSVHRMVEHVKTYLPSSYLIAGNVATPAAVQRLEAAGADAVKVGIGPGLACTTAPNTGFGTRDWQLSALEWCASAATSAHIIADGGIREYGDIAKSIAFGADMVMIGGMFAAHDESPGELIEDELGQKHKAFFGSASEYQKGEVKHVEGKKMLVPYRGPLTFTLQHMRENLQSSISYAGGNKLADLRNASYVLVR